MVDISMACIDRYEAPNVAGEKPMIMATADEGEAWCAARGKRLCTEDEWLRACSGPGKLRYPYGARYDEHACNQDKTYRVPRWQTLSRWPADDAKAEVARLDQAEASGARATCGSAEGVHDLTGNVAEWVVRTHPHPEACQTTEQRQHRHVAQGCSWTKCFRAPHEPACDYVNCAHPGAFRSYEIGFRYCRDRSPSSTEP
jgi:formylglycine-generating enzyme required for sulfatase activity